MLRAIDRVSNSNNNHNHSSNNHNNHSSHNHNNSSSSNHHHHRSSSLCPTQARARVGSKRRMCRGSLRPRPRGT